MRINNNIAAINTHRQYGINNTNVSKSTEKLSSGYRINRAGDDAAGLAISEKMRAQIRGLTMASKNSQDAISLVQTAEGALQESHNILQRMRELAVQSASDTNETTIDRGALEQEFQQLIKELDDTANKTRFNDQNLIDGTFQAKSTTLTAAIGYTTTANTSYSSKMDAGVYTHTSTFNAAEKVTVSAGVTATVDKMITASKVTTLALNATNWDGATLGTTATAKLSNFTQSGDNPNVFNLEFEIEDAAGAKSTLTFAATLDPATGVIAITGDTTDFGVTIDFDVEAGTTADELKAALEKIKADTTGGVVIASSAFELASTPRVTADWVISSGTETLGMTDAFNGNYTIEMITDDFGAATMDFALKNEKGETVAKISDLSALQAPSADGTVDLDFGQFGVVTVTVDTGGGPIATIKEWKDALSTLTITVKNGAAEVKTGPDAYAKITGTDGSEVARIKAGDTGYVGTDGIRVDFGKAVTDADLANATAWENFLGGETTATFIVSDVQGKSLTIQTGANQGDDLQINIDKMDAWNLGVSFSSVKNLESAQNAITEVNNAINQVSTQRAALGALQNRLDHKIANLDTSAENLTSAESRIRDIDMAKEMTNFTKNNILFQASTAMLAQANAMPQGVLQLLG